MRMKRGILFDLDGTLWDSSSQVVASWNETLEHQPDVSRRITIEDMESLINQLYSLGLPGYYGSILASILGYGLSFIICLVVLNQKCGVNYEKTLKQGINALCGTVIMVIVLLLVKLIVPISASVRFLNILIIAVYAVIGMAVYFFYMYKTNSVQEVFGDKLLTKFKKKRARS